MFFTVLFSDTWGLARITAHDRGSYLVIDAAGERRARISGSLRHRALDPVDLPVVGDRVRVQSESAGAITIVAIAPRMNLFARRAAGGSGDIQPIAANLDRLFVVAALNREFNVRRIERYLAAARACAVPVAIVLTKSDLVADPDSNVAAVRAVASDAAVFAVSALERRGFDGFTPHRGIGRTIAFVGSSGTGKSTLMNWLLGSDEFATGEIRSDDGRGRHTTTRRELRFLEDGTAVIDTPGMREFALVDGEGDANDAFEDISEFAAACRFRDCRHEREPGCAVRENLDPDRLRSWRKLSCELAFEERKVNPKAPRAEGERWKAIHAAQRQTEAFRKRQRPS